MAKTSEQTTKNTTKKTTTKKTASQTKKTEKTEEAPNINGVFQDRKYIEAVGRRKTAMARVRLYDKGEGHMAVNGVKPDEYFDEGRLIIAKQPLKTTGHLKDLDFSIVAKGSGKNGQAEAIRHGLARVLCEFDKELRPVLKAKGWLTRDDRKKERKKPGLKKARRAPQWSKR
ncbi:MAG: 30S ribosomal protein S9 [Patescibacteria group bacterium]